MQMTPQRWSYTRAYLRTVFGTEDKQLRTLMPRATDGGIPDIAVSADVGRALKILASTTNAGHGPRLAIELGTLAGYSGIWIARALAAAEFGGPGKLITFEQNPVHADFAQREFANAGLADRIEIRRGGALDGVQRLSKEISPGAVDFAFIDAAKIEYPAYYELIRPLIAPGGIMVADNALGSNSWWIDEHQGSSPDRDAVDRLNRTVAADPLFESTCFPLHHGLLVARRI